LISKYLNCKPDFIPKLSQQQHDRITELIRGLQFRPTHRPQVKRLKIKRLCPNNAYDVKIDVPESNEKSGKNEKIDIFTYFQRRYKITLRYAYLVELDDRRSDKIPIELCKIIEVFFCLLLLL